MKLILAPLGLLFPGAAIALLATIGDTTIAAAITGVFVTFNTVLLWRLQHPIKATHKAITSPRRIVYDADGRPIGTVLDLRGDPDFDMDSLLVTTQRRLDDEQT